MADYQTLRVLHVIGAVLLVGNVTVTGVWSLYLYRAWRSGDFSFRPVARGILWTDLIFTVGGGVLLTFSGIQMVVRSGLPWLDTPWLGQGIAALAVGTLVWLLVLLPDQIRMERATDPAQIRRLFIRWSVVGWADTLVLYYGLWAMVSKAGT